MLTLKPDTKYYVSWFMRGQDLVESRLEVRNTQLSPSVTQLDYVVWNQNGSYDWVKRVGFFKTPDDYVSGRIQISWTVASGSTFWIDDLTLCAADEPCADAYLKERE